MNGCSDFVVLCEGDACMSWSVALIIGLTIIVSVGIVVLFLRWKILKEQKFEQEIFENFRRRTCQVGNAQNNGQNNGTTPSNVNVQNPGGTNGK